MSTIERSLSWLESVADWANPILVKETRQALKSRQFVVTFMLMLIVSWCLFVFFVLAAGSALEYGSVGAWFFEVFYWILAIAVMIVVPFTAQRSLLAERDQATYDLLSITTLTPQQIVRGKLLSGLVQTLIYYSAIAPFMAFTSLLQGFDFVFVVSKLVLTLLLSLFLTMAAITASTTMKSRQWQGFAAIGGLVGIGWLAMVLLSGLDGFLRFFDPSNPEQWAGLMFVVTIGASFFVLFHKVATAQLTFESDDRSSGIRIVCSVQFFLVWIGLFAYAGYVGSFASVDEDVIVFATILSGLHLLIVGLFASTESPFLSRRVLRNLPSSRFRRLIHVPFLQGGARGYLYILGHILLYAVVTSWLTAAFVSPGTWSFALPMAFSFYLVIYLGIASWLSRTLNSLSPDIRPGHVRVLMIILSAIASIAPFIPLFWRDFGRFHYDLTFLLNPVWTLLHIAESGSSADTAIVILGLVALGVVLVNLSAMKRGIGEVVFAEVKPRTHQADAQ